MRVTVENWKKVNQKGQIEDAQLKLLEESVPVTVQEALSLTFCIYVNKQTNKKT